MRTIFYVLVAIAAFALTSASGFAFTIQEVVSPGGIRAWLVAEKTVPLISMKFSFRGGSVEDPAGKEGISEFLTGMMDEGAGGIDSKEFQQQRDALAFRMSFDSEKDYFEGGFQTLSRNRDASFELLRMALSQPRFEWEPLERVRQQFLLKVKDNGDDPQRQAILAWMGLALPGDLYSRDGGGNAQTFSSFTAEDLRAARQRIFTRNSLQVAVVGDVDAAALGPLLDKIFGGLPPGKMRSGPPAPVSFARQSLFRHIEREMPQSLIVFGHEGILRSDPDFIPAYIMSEILGGGGFNSRLTAEIREKRGLTYGVGFGLSLLQRAGLFIGTLQTSNANAGEAMSLVREVLERMAREGPTQQELDEAKTYLTGSYALRFSKNSAIASQLLAVQQQELGIDYVTRRNSLIEAVTLEQVKAQAKKLLHPDRLIVTVVGKPEGLK
jgi:zinc protease